MRLPKRNSRTGPRINTVKLVRVWVSTNGESKACPAKRLPVKTALPKVAAAPQQNVAVAIKQYPRHGCFRAVTGVSSLGGLLCKHLVQAVRIKTDHDLITNNDCGSGAAIVGAYQFKDRLLVRTDILDFKLNPFLRKVGLSP